MFGSLKVQDTITHVLSRLFRIPNEGKPISVIDLSTVPHEILDVAISVISRLGQGVSMPMRIRFDELSSQKRPKNRNIGFSKS